MYPATHPLRRVSTGSLSSLARSQDRHSSHHHHSPSGLDFLEPAFTELADEVSTLSTNINRMNELYNALDDFNEGFSAYLYALKMNAFCIEWMEAPDPTSWHRLRDLTVAAEGDRPENSALANSLSRAEENRAQSSSPTPPSAADTTYATVYSVGDELGPKRDRISGRPASRGSVPRPGSAPSGPHKRATLAAKKRREVQISKIIDTQLPLEYRGGDPDARLVMEKVIARLVDEPNGLTIGAIVSTPILSHPRVNKALIALVAKKLVTKSNEKGKTMYHWIGSL